MHPYPIKITNKITGLDDLTVRFLLNLPPSELSSVPRLCFQVEEAHWFYEDFVRPLAATAGNPLPNLALKQFCLLLFQHCPLLSGFTDAQHIAAYEEFLAYKVRVPVRGAILLDEKMEQAVLVRGWKKGASWSFPRGKINKDELDLDCALREVWEETGFDARAAGVVPKDEDKAKYIDITMREQHMRLFVFRNVPLDTNFVTQTRKEISKIQWYHLRDLPGFAKKGRGEADVNANKFYMVAPFLNSLKKWIGQQQKMDEAAKKAEMHGLGVSQDVAEGNESEAPEPSVIGPAPATASDRSEELRKMLSIGGSVAGALSQPIPPNQPAQANTLLAMLKGAGPTANNAPPPPQTPLEQMQQFPQQPHTPQPHHPRNTSMGYQHPPPQFPFSPQRLQPQQVQQHGFPGQASEQFGQNSGLPFGGPPQMQHPQQTFNHHHPKHPNQQFGQARNMPFDPRPQQQQYARDPSMTFQGHAQDAQYSAQGPGAIAAGPAVPKASQLPTPKLNSHAMSLLDALKSGAPKPVTTSSTVNGAPRQQNAHQNALLSLFKQPSNTQVPKEASMDEAVVSPTLSDVTLRPAALQERRPTLNEITRTLPKARTPSQPSSAVPPVQAPSVPSPARSNAQVAAAVPEQNARAVHSNVTSSQVAQKPQFPAPRSQKDPVGPQKLVQKRGPSRQALSSPQPSRSRGSSSPSKRAKPNSAAQNTHSVPFTILTRPGSAKGMPGSPAHAPAPAAAINNEAPRQSFQPQLLKRHDGVEDDRVPIAPLANGSDVADDSGRRSQLLSLFGKSSSNTPAPQSPATEAPLPPAASKPDASKTKLLDLFNSATPKATTSHPPRPEPPRAPSLQPELKVSQNTTPTPLPIQTATTQQTTLLDLFRKSSSTASPKSETPISPFTLDSPNVVRASQLQPVRTNMGPPQLPLQEQPRSRLGSMASSGRETPTSGSAAATPKEDKGFLLGFLNGVVQKEGKR